jgi:exopolysaccharide production protein ExoQ
MDAFFQNSATIALALLGVILLGLGLPLATIAGRARLWVAMPVAVLVMSVVPLGAVDAEVTSEGSMVRQIGWGAVFCIAAWVAFNSAGKMAVVRASWVPTAFALLLTYAVVSVAWSPDPFVSFKRVVQLLGVVVIAVALVRRQRERAALEQLFWPGLWLLIVGVAAVAFPSLAFDADGNFKGVGITKNVWAQCALLVCLLGFAKARGARGHKRFLLVVATFGALLILALTRSATTLLALVLALSVVALPWVAARVGGMVPATALVCSLVTIAILGVQQTGMLESAAPLLGKDATLTGRTFLWELLAAEIAKHPWFGLGYGGFWIGTEGPSWLVVRLLEWGPGQGHNGYLDVINELGYVGFALLLAVLLGHAVRLFNLFKTGLRDFALLHSSVLIATLVLNFAETSLLRSTALWWIVLTISIIEVQVMRRLFARENR